MAIERTYIVNLRHEWLKVPLYKRAKKAVKGLKVFLMRHMKQKDPKFIKVGPFLNEAIWARGMRNPLHKVKITVIKEDDGTVKAELFGHKYTAKKRPEKKEEEGGIAGKIKESLGIGKKEKEAEIKEEKKPEKKEEKKEKPAKKEEKKEAPKKPAEKKPAKKK